jgi:hypothetical protein
MTEKVSNGGMSIKQWVEYHQGRHFCKCGCNEEITIKVHHRYYGIPEYILNHYQKTDDGRKANSERVIQQYKDHPELKKQISLSIQGVGEGMTNQEWVDSENDKKTHYCKCGCNELIIIKSHHRYQGIPEYIHNHYQKSEEGLIDNSERGIQYHKDHPEIGIEHGKYISQLYKDKPGILEQISASLQGVSLEDWEGFISDERRQFMASQEYAQWRTTIFERDDYTCQECGQRGCDLNGHHLLPYRDYPDPQFSLNPKNGITLCVECHRKTFGKEYEFWCRYFDIAIANGIR